MRKIKKFNEYNKFNEGIGNLFRDLTGKNKKRIDSILDILRNVEFPKFESEDIKNYISKKWENNVKSFIDKNKSDKPSNWESIKGKLQILLVDLFKNSDSTTAKNLEFIKELSSKDFDTLYFMLKYQTSNEIGRAHV